jgi:hypothetical protein
VGGFLHDHGPGNTRTNGKSISVSFTIGFTVALTITEPKSDGQPIAKPHPDWRPDTAVDANWPRFHAAVADESADHLERIHRQRRRGRLPVLAWDDEPGYHDQPRLAGHRTAA